MERRDLLKQVVSLTVGAGVLPSRVSTLDGKAVPALAVLECSGPISFNTREILYSVLSNAFKETPFEGLKCLILDEGFRLTFLDAQGNILNEPASVGIPSEG